MPSELPEFTRKSTGNLPEIAHGQLLGGGGGGVAHPTPPGRYGPGGGGGIVFMLL